MSDRCFVAPDGSCVSPFDCPHGPPHPAAVKALLRLGTIQTKPVSRSEYGRSDSALIPFEEAQALCTRYNLKQAIIVAWDGEREHVVTFGTSLGDADNAAEGGNFVKEALHWPPETYSTSDRVHRLAKAAKALLDRLAERDRSMSLGHGELSFHREAQALDDLLHKEGLHGE